MHGRVLEKLIVTQLVNKVLALIQSEISYCFDNRGLLVIILRYVRNGNDQRFQSGVLKLCRILHSKTDFHSLSHGF